MLSSLINFIRLDEANESFLTIAVAFIYEHRIVKKLRKGILRGKQGFPLKEIVF